MEAEDEANLREFRTDDLCMAAWLVSRGHRVVDVRLEHQESMPFAYFYFKDTTESIADVEEFVKDRASVEPKRFSRIFGQLKARIYDLQGGRNRNARQSIRTRS